MRVGSIIYVIARFTVRLNIVCVCNVFIDFFDKVKYSKNGDVGLSEYREKYVLQLHYTRIFFVGFAL